MPYGISLLSDCTEGSLYLRPMKRFTSKIVFERRDTSLLFEADRRRLLHLRPPSLDATSNRGGGH